MKTVLITGASGGIGSACAIEFLKNGYNVAATYLRNKQGVDALSEHALNSGLVAIRADVTSEEDIRRAFEETIEAFGSIDAVINNAGISLHGLIQDVTSEELSRIIDTNIKGSFYVCQNAARHMISCHCGSIINISSMWGEAGASCEAAYSMTKAAIIGLTKALGKELGPSGIRVNCITPGLIDTPMNAQIDRETIDYICEETPLMRIGTPMDVAHTALFLAEDKSSFITGQVIGVNGGYVI